MGITQNAVRSGVRPYVLPEMAEGDFRLMIYQTTVQRFIINTSTMSEQSLNTINLYTISFTYNTFYIIQIHSNTKQTIHFISLAPGLVWGPTSLASLNNVHAVLSV